MFPGQEVNNFHSNVKTKEVLLSADFLDDLGRKTNDIHSLLRGDGVKDTMGMNE